jgi:hypothetical protein
MLTEQILSRICGEYLEMPGLALTRKQAQRLWCLDEATCTQVLEFLVAVRFLRRSDTDMYVRCAEGAAPLLELRMARAHLRQNAETSERGSRG